MVKELPENAYPEERLSPEELRRARQHNLAEFDRRSTTRIYTIEQTRWSPKKVEISYGVFGMGLPLEAKDKVKPGAKIVVVQKSEDQLSPVESIYVLGENLLERPKE